MCKKDIEEVRHYLDYHLETEVSLKDAVIDFLTDNNMNAVLTDIGINLLSSVFDGARKSDYTSDSSPNNDCGSGGDDNRKLSVWLSEQKEKNERFQVVLKNFLQQKGYENNYSGFYNKIDMDRRLFSRIVSESYESQVDKKTVFKLVIGLELALSEAEELLRAAGYCFNNHKKLDLIIKYCVENKIYDPFCIDDYLISFGEKALFSLE